MPSRYDAVRGHILPQIPLHEAREVMTRADFIQSYDAINVFTIDSNAMVRAGQSRSQHQALPGTDVDRGTSSQIHRFCTNDERLP